MEQGIDPLARRLTRQAFNRRHIFQKFNCGQVGVDAEILGQIAEDIPQDVRVFGDILAAPYDFTFGWPGNGRQHPH